MEYNSYLLTLIYYIYLRVRNCSLNIMLALCCLPFHDIYDSSSWVMTYVSWNLSKCIRRRENWTPFYITPRLIVKYGFKIISVWFSFQITETEPKFRWPPLVNFQFFEVTPESYRPIEDSVLSYYSWCHSCLYISLYLWLTSISRLLRTRADEHRSV